MKTPSDFSASLIWISVPEGGLDASALENEQLTRQIVDPVKTKTRDDSVLRVPRNRFKEELLVAMDPCWGDWTRRIIR